MYRITIANQEWETSMPWATMKELVSLGYKKMELWQQSGNLWIFDRIVKETEIHNHK